MAVSTQALVRDNSTLVNFKQWAKAISDFFTTAGWVQSGDTGQVNWSTIASVPAVNNFVYEIWTPNDGLTTFYLKVEYGTNSASTNTGPQLRMSIGTATNGSGTLSGIVTALQSQPISAASVASTSTQWASHFSGDSGRMGIVMWREAENDGSLAFFIARSVNSSGTPTSSHVTLYSAGKTTASAVGQQTLVFGVGAGNAVTPGANNQSMFLCINNTSLSTALFNGSISISPVFPDIGYFDNPTDVLGVGKSNDFTDGAQYVISSANMPYGVSHTYIACTKLPYNKIVGQTAGSGVLLMRYD